MGKKRAQGKKLPKINSCVVWEKGKSFSLTTHANRIDYCLCVKKEKVPGTRSFVFIFRRSRTRARASNRLRVRSVKILCSFSREGKRKTDKHNTRTVFLSRAVEKIWSFRIYSRRRKTKTNRRKAKTTVFIARRLFVCSRLVVVQIQTYHQTNILGELDFFLSLRKKRQNKNRFFTRSWFYFTLFRRQKRRSVGVSTWREKTNNKNPSSL